MRRGGRKRPVAKGCPYGKPKTSGAVKQQKPERNLQSIAEVSLNIFPYKKYDKNPIFQECL